MLRVTPCTALLVLAFVCPAAAGIPRGVSLSADEQIADDKTGEIIARGNAEIAVVNTSINGRADVIQLRPQANEVVLKGRAVLTVGHRRYESDTVACSLDFMRCAAEAADQPEPLATGSAATMP